MQNLNAKHCPAVTYRFKNIGPIKKADIELGDLTIIAGHNNTGKTYLVYTLYGLLKGWQDWPYADDLMMGKDRDLFPPIREIAKNLQAEGKVKIKIDRQALESQRSLLIKEVIKDFSTQALSGVFSSKDEAFKDASIEVKFNGEVGLPVRTTLERPGLSMDYDGEHILFVFEAAKEPRPLNYFIADLYFRFLLGDFFPDPFILSAERFGISLFYKELDFTKNQLVDLLQKISDDKNRDSISPYLIIDQTTSRYALPIKDNIDYTRGTPDLGRLKSSLHEKRLFDDIKEMMGGYFRMSGDEIRFISKTRGSKRFNIPLHLASSSARGLSDLYFFLRSVAKDNHLLIIDEPESHLDTANQIQLARLLARLVRSGLSVLITTHSDYLIKEVNNLVMLSGSFPGKTSVQRNLKYRKDDFLIPESIRAYVAEKSGLRRCEVDRFGIDMPVFDRTIDEINNVANELSSRLIDQPED